MLFRILFLFFVSFNIPIAKAQLPTGSQDEADTFQIKKNILEFTRLSFNKLNIDSIVKFCSFPFYNKTWRTIKKYNSAAELKLELKRSFKRQKYIPVIYSTDTIFKCDSCQTSMLKNRALICFKMRTYMPYVGEGTKGSILMTSFFIEKKMPYRIIGMEEGDQ